MQQLKIIVYIQFVLVLVTLVYFIRKYDNIDDRMLHPNYELDSLFKHTDSIRNLEIQKIIKLNSEKAITINRYETTIKNMFDTTIVNNDSIANIITTKLHKLRDNTYLLY